ncbi:unnamed protein product [Cochlearia groenlandica]
MLLWFMEKNHYVVSNNKATEKHLDNVIWEGNPSLPSGQASLSNKESMIALTVTSGHRFLQSCIGVGSSRLGYVGIKKVVFGGSEYMTSEESGFIVHKI